MAAKKLSKQPKPLSDHGAASLVREFLKKNGPSAFSDFFGKGKVVSHVMPIWVSGIAYLEQSGEAIIEQVPSRHSGLSTESRVTLKNHNFEKLTPWQKQPPRIPPPIRTKAT